MYGQGCCVVVTAVGARPCADQRDLLQEVNIAALVVANTTKNSRAEGKAFFIYAPKEVFRPSPSNSCTRLGEPKSNTLHLGT
jgi:hypothetical protein